MPPLLHSTAQDWSLVGTARLAVVLQFAAYVMLLLVVPPADGPLVLKAAAIVVALAVELWAVAAVVAKERRFCGTAFFWGWVTLMGGGFLFWLGHDKKNHLA